MSTSYHDEKGNPASRAEMLAIMHSLASTGHASEYLQLKEEFDVIENESMVVISKSTLAELLAIMLATGVHIPKDVSALLDADAVITPSDQDVKKRIYESLDKRTLATIVEDMIIRTNNGYDDMGEDIKTVLIASDYDKEVVYAAVETQGLSYEERVEIVNKYAPNYFYLIANLEPNRVFKENREDFLSALKGLTTETRKTTENNYQVCEFLRTLSMQAETEDELWLAINSVPYGMFGSSVSGRIAENPLITKEQVLTILDRDIATGGRNYWHVRSYYSSMILEETGVELEKLPEHNNKIKPIREATPTELMQELAALQESIRNSNRSDEDMADVEKSIQTRMDTYEVNFMHLKKKIKDAKKLYGHTKSVGVLNNVNVRRLETRLVEAEQLLSQIEDLKSFRRTLLKADLSSKKRS
jgi:hypothetical protein